MESFECEIIFFRVTAKPNQIFVYGIGYYESWNDKKHRERERGRENDENTRHRFFE